jgi:hypothetical protein
MENRIVTSQWIKDTAADDGAIMGETQSTIAQAYIYICVCVCIV